jgi:hypothetical protein
MRHVVIWHIGIANVDDGAWKGIVAEQASVLNKYTVYLGLHATSRQVPQVHALLREFGITAVETNWYEDDVWEVPTLEWMWDTVLPNMGDDDYVSYVHSKGMTSLQHDTRRYIMDLMFMRLDPIVQQMSTDDLDTCGCFGHMVAGTTNGSYWLSMWVSKVSHLRTIGRIPRTDAGRWDSEEYMKFNIGRAMFADKMLCVDNDPETLVGRPFGWLNGSKWAPSDAFLSRIAPASKVYPVQSVEPSDSDAFLSRVESKQSVDVLNRIPNWIHFVYSGIVFAVLVALIVVVFQLKR